MKKTTPALIATFLISLFLGGGMFMIGLDATRTTTATAVTAANPQAIVNIYTNPAPAGAITLKSVPATSSNTRTLLRTSGS